MTDLIGTPSSSPQHTSQHRWHDVPLERDVMAKAVAAEVRPGMIVGLGTGRSAARVMRALAVRIRDEKLDIDCVASSLATESLARELKLPTVPPDDIEVIDYYFDGADEVDQQLRMMKGHHGAITRQRLVAHVSRRCVYMANEDKVVSQLGSKALLAVTIIPFGVASIRARLRNLGLSGVVRRNLENEVVITDGGGVVLDMRIAGRDVNQLALELDHVPGVVDHGLFLTEADEVFIECRDGSLRHIIRPEDPNS